MQSFISILLALGTGLAVGIIFTLLKLPAPAPLAIEGIAGIIGIYLGYLIIHTWMK